MNMKYKYILLTFLLFLISCGENVEQKGEKRLILAQQAFQNKDYNEAKLQIDSIKILYPKAFEARRAGIKLMQEVELEEQNISLIYLDSIHQVKEEEFQACKNKFTFEKDEEYQTIGNYFWPTQTVERNLKRSYLRFQVSELGVLTMTSFFNNTYNINHTKVRVTAPDGSFAETPTSKDCYQTTDLGRKIEQARFTIKEDGDVVGFIAMNKDKRLKVTYFGDRNFEYDMQANDKEAAYQIYQLHKILAAIQQIEEERKEAKLKIEFVSRKIREREEKELNLTN